MNKKITVITVTYNSADFIEKTILSVINQTYDNLEYIIIDGGSTDETLSIIQKHRDRLAYFVSEPDKSMYDAINKGLKVATGDYVAILNSDDYYVDNETISNVVDFVNNDIITSSGGVYGNLVKVTEKGVEIRKRRCFQVSYKELLFSKKLTPVGHASLFISKQCLNDIGFYDIDSFQYAADYDYVLRCFSKFEFKHINVNIFNFRQHPNSITSSGKIAMENDEVLIKNGYFNHPFIIRKFYYYLVWTKFLVLNLRNLSNKL